MDKKENSCARCAHYYITWDKEFPYGCKSYGFKTREEPRYVVKKMSDQECLLFEEKKRGPKEER
jgi:hypothetical protein